MKVEISPTARRQIAEFVQWWDRNRPAARVRVEGAVASALAAIAEHPELGRRYPPRPQYRTWRLLGTPYVLFYRVDQATETILITVAWSAMRGAAPKLP